MSDHKHTPGPWRLGTDLTTINPDWRDEQGNSLPSNLHRNGFAKRILRTTEGSRQDWRPIEQLVADGRLAAASPTMLTALLRVYHEWDGEPEDVLHVREAIKLATGR